MRSKWSQGVQTTLCPRLLDDVGFQNSAALIDRLSRDVEIQIANDKFRPGIEIGNELAAAERLLAAAELD